MNLKEFKDMVDKVIEYLPKNYSLEEFEVVVTTNDCSVGGRAKSKVKAIYRGIDWEHNQIRIETEDNLIKEQK